MEVLNLRPKLASQAVETCVKVSQPIFLWGPPGIGKSQIVAQLAKELGYVLRDIRAVLFDPVDLRGLPHVGEDGRADWATPSWLPKEGDAPVLLFIDELNRAPVLVQNAFFQLILDRKLGEYELPDNCRIVAAGNRESDGGGVTRMPQALANRFVHINVETSLDDWTSWAASHDIQPVVIAFIRYRQNLLHQYSREDHAFPTPRSWEFVSKIVGHASQETELALVSGTVGQGAAVEFMAFLKLFRNLPDIDRIITNPDSVPVSNDIATLYAVTSALAQRADVNNFSNIIRYLDRCPSEYAVFAIRDAVVRDKALQSTNEFTKWAVANASLLMN